MTQRPLNEQPDSGDAIRIPEPNGPERRRVWLLRRPTWWCRLLAVPFLGALLGVLVIVLLYHWPTASFLVYYITVRPSFVWLGALAPFLLVGIAAVRLRWFLCGCAIWLLGLVGTEEVLQLLKPFPESAREEFAYAQMGHWSFRESPTGRTAEHLDVPLRIVTWNVQSGRKGADGAVKDLARLAPDIVLMQEFCDNTRAFRKACKRSEYFKDYDLVDLAGKEVILSRYTVERLPSVPADTGPRDVRWLCSVWKVHVANDMHIICINVHLAPLALKTQLIRGVSRSAVAEAIATKRAELRRLTATLNHYAKEGPIILAGDFNLPLHYPDLRKATASLKDCFTDNGYGWGKTAPGKMPLIRVDMIFVPPEATVYYAGAVPTRHSDHYMTLAEVALPLTRRQQAGTAAPSDGP